MTSRYPFLTKYVLIAVLMLNAFLGVAQDQGGVEKGIAQGWSSGVELGIGLPERITALDQEVSGQPFSMAGDIGYLLPVTRHLSFRNSVEGYFAFQNGSLAGSLFKARTTRIGLESLIGLGLSPKLLFQTGVNVRNQVDLKDYDARSKGNVRWEWRVVPTIYLSQVFSLEMTYLQAFYNKSQINFIPDARRQIRLGIRYAFKQPQSK